MTLVTPRTPGSSGRLAASATGALAVLLMGLFPARGVSQVPRTPREIIDHVDRLLRGRSSTGRIRMEIETAHWSRSMELEVWSLGRDYSLIRVLSPRSEAGTATLMSGDQVWNYLPRADRTIKIPPSMMMGSWMGSHFTNDDLVKERQLVDDYDITLSFEGEGEGTEIWEFTLMPKPEAAVVWSKVVYQVRKADMMPIQVLYYDEDGAVARTMTFSDFRTMGGRLVPAVMTVEPADKPGEYTRVVYEDLEFDVDLSEDFFSLRNLRATR